MVEVTNLEKAIEKTRKLEALCRDLVELKSKIFQSRREIQQLLKFKKTTYARSEEVRQKMAKSQKERWAKRKHHVIAPAKTEKHELTYA